MHVVGLGTASPPHRYAQRDCWEALRNSAAFSRLAPRSRAILKKVLCADTSIATRHLALNPLSDAFAREFRLVRRRTARGRVLAGQ